MLVVAVIAAATTTATAVVAVAAVVFLTGFGIRGALATLSTLTSFLAFGALATLATFTARTTSLPAFAVAALALTTSATVATVAFTWGARTRDFDRWFFLGIATEPAEQFGDKATLFFRSRLLCRGGFERYGRRLRRGNVADRCRLAILVLLFDRERRRFDQRLIDHLVRRLPVIVLIQFVMTQTLNLMCRCFQVLVRQQQDGDLVTQFDRLNVGTFFVEQEGGDVDRHLGVNRRSIFFHRLFFQDAQDVQRSRFGGADVARARTTRAGDVRGFCQCRA